MIQGLRQETRWEDDRDQVEELSTKSVEIDYPADCSYCDLTIEDSPLEIRITSSGVTVHAPQSTAPKKLVQSFIGVQRALAGSPVLKAIAASSKK